MKKVIRAIFDAGSLLELSPHYGKNLLTFLARIGGRPIAVVANQPMVHAGCLDVAASRKGAQFVRWAGWSSLPVITLVDVPGYLPGEKQEQGGILPFGALLLEAYGQVSVPRVSLTVRKSFGGASVLTFNADIRLALPTARCGVMGVDAAAEVAFGPERSDLSDAERSERASTIEKWRRERDSAWAASEAGYVDRVIDPAKSRSELYYALRSLGMK